MVILSRGKNEGKSCQWVRCWRTIGSRTGATRPSAEGISRPLLRTPRSGSSPRVIKPERDEKRFSWNRKEVSIPPMGVTESVKLLSLLTEEVRKSRTIRVRIRQRKLCDRRNSRVSPCLLMSSQASMPRWFFV